MHISDRYLGGQPIDAASITAQPIRSEKIEEIFRRVKKRIENQA